MRSSVNLHAVTKVESFVVCVEANAFTLRFCAEDSSWHELTIFCEPGEVEQRMEELVQATLSLRTMWKKSGPTGETRVE